MRTLLIIPPNEFITLFIIHQLKFKFFRHMIISEFIQLIAILI